MVRVVIADDDEVYAHALRTQLSEHSHLDIVGLAGNGREAVDLAAGLEPDLILMDVNMPVLDGVDATRALRALPKPPSVVLITGDDGDADSRAYEAGAAAYLRKSIDASALADMLVTFSQLSRVPA